MGLIESIIWVTITCYNYEFGFVEDTRQDEQGMDSIYCNMATGLLCF